MGYQVGLDCMLYYDPDGVGQSSWTLLDDVETVNRNEGTNTATVKNRASKFEKDLPGQKTVEFTATMTVDRASADFTALQTAYDSRAMIGIAMMDGPIATSGTKGRQANVLITQFNETEELEDVVKVELTFKLHANSSSDPARVTVA